jgi:hypothetical protein
VAAVAVVAVLPEQLRAVLVVPVVVALEQKAQMLRELLER